MTQIPLAAAVTGGGEVIIRGMDMFRTLQHILAGVACGIAMVIACGGSGGSANDASAAGEDAGTCSGSCTVSGPITLAGPVRVKTADTDLTQLRRGEIERVADGKSQKVIDGPFVLTNMQTSYGGAGAGLFARLFVVTQGTSCETYDVTAGSPGYPPNNVAELYYYNGSSTAGTLVPYISGARIVIRENETLCVAPAPSIYWMHLMWAGFVPYA